MKRLLQCFFCLTCFCLFQLQGMAQSISVSGTVTSAEDNTPLPGVTVLEKGTNNGVSTDIDGKYTIQVETGSVLVYSFIGLLSEERTVGAENVINVSLATDTKTLEEVVVVGYGTQKRANLTGAVSTVDTEVLQARPITDVARGLQGTTPGLTITTSTGQIGQDANINIRGITGTLSGDTKPLILVDGVETPSLQMVNPNDIESVSVLKDAASASIYGARGAWGVVLITTKSGRRNSDPTISYSNNFSWATPTTTPKLASAAEGAEMAFEALHRTDPSTDVFGIVGMYFDQASIQKMREWEQQYGGQDLGPEMVLGRDFEILGDRLFFYRPWDAGEMFMRDWAPQQKHDLSVSGGSEKTNYFLGLGYLGQKGVLKVNPDEFNRYNVNLSVNTTVTNWLDLSGKVLYSKTHFTRPFYFSSETYDPWYYLYRWPRTYPYGTYNGHPFRSAITEVQQAKMNQENESLARMNLGAKLKPFAGLTVDVNYTYSENNFHDHRTGGVLSAYNFWSTGAALKYEPYSSASYNRVEYISDWDNRHVGKLFATYEKTLEDNHALKVIAGSDIESYEYWYQSSQKRDLMDLDKGEIDLATGEQYVGGAREKWNNLGFFGRINYAYKDKYLLELNGRYDGSSRLSPTKEWAFFPSMSLGWVISEESFMDFSSPVLSFLKLRGSWGAIGNQNTDPEDIYRIMPTYNSGWLVGGTNMPTASTPGAFPYSLTWETVTTLDFGLDSRFFNNKVGVSFDWYRRTVSDMISGGVTLPATFGTAAANRNYGELQTTGWELAIDFNHSFDNGLNLHATGMLSDFTEKVTKYANTTKALPDPIKGRNFTYYEGMEIGEIWGYETDRFFTADDFTQNDDGTLTLKDGIPSQELYESSWFFYGPGDVKYKDLNGDGVIDYGSQTVDDHGDMKVIGNSTPHYQYGLRLGADWKGFDLSLFIQGVGKRDFWANGPIFIPGYRPHEGWYAHQLDYWTPENPDAFYPRPTDHSQSNEIRNFLPQTKYLLDLSYMRMKNLTVGYTLPATLTERISLKQVRVYFSGENLFEFDNLGDMPIDPEVDYSEPGLNDPNTFGRVYPYRRTLSFGLQASF